MKKFKIALLYMIYTGLLLAGCNDEERQTLPANEISDLALTTNQGTTTLNWHYVEDTEENRNRYVEIRYHDPVVGKDVMKTVSGYESSYRIENTGSKYGEYTFTLQPFSQTFTPGTIQTVKGTAEDKVETPDEPSEPAIPVLESTVMNLEPSAIAVLVLESNGTEKTKCSPADYQSKGILTDGKDNTIIYPWGSAGTEDVWNIYVTCAKPQTYLKFYYKNSTSTTNNRVITELECYVRATETDEWQKVTTLTTVDGLPDQASGEFISKECKASVAFTYVKFIATMTKSIYGSYKSGFCMSEFKMYDVVEITE